MDPEPKEDLFYKLTVGETEDYDGIENLSCYICNGFYGPCFEEPVCTTCHTFLFPEPWCCTNETNFTESGDDGDSGNDEPVDNYGAPGNSEEHVLSSRPRQVQIMHINTNANEEGNTRPVWTIDQLPPEVLLVVFSYLDDISLWSVGSVCRRWRNLLITHISDEIWKEYTQKRFPIYKPLCAVNYWFQVYEKLMNCCPCRACLLQMSKQSEPPGEENSWRRNRLRSELKGLRADRPQGIFAIPLDAKCCHWQASITGPVGSPYEGGIFYLYLQVPSSYPMKPPVVRFLTKVFHPNVSRHGDVGIDSIQHNWSLALTIPKILISVQSLLTDPYCDVCMEPMVGKLYKENKTAFSNIARAWTWKYAMTDLVLPHSNKRE